MQRHVELVNQATMSKVRPHKSCCSLFAYSLTAYALHHARYAFDRTSICDNTTVPVTLKSALQVHTNTSIQSRPALYAESRSHLILLWALYDQSPLSPAPCGKLSFGTTTQSLSQGNSSNWERTTPKSPSRSIVRFEAVCYPNILERVFLLLNGSPFTSVLVPSSRYSLGTWLT